MRKDVHKQINVDELIHILEMDQFDVFDYITEQLEKTNQYLFVTDFANYLFCVPTKKANQICLVSHVDTLAGKVKVKVENGCVLKNKHGVLGADDRAGVYAILEMARRCKAKPYLLFTQFEESGGVGVKVCIQDKAIDAYVHDINLFVELDRRGVDEYVTYCTLPKKLENILESLGYHEEHGIYSDVSDLTDHYEIAHVNLAVGYYKHHTTQERLNLYGLSYAIVNCLALMGAITCQYKAIPQTYNSYYDSSWNKYYKSQRWNNDYSDFTSDNRHSKAHKKGALTVIDGTKSAATGSSLMPAPMVYTPKKIEVVTCPVCGESGASLAKVEHDRWDCYNCLCVFDNNYRVVQFSDFAKQKYGALIDQD